MQLIDKEKFSNEMEKLYCEPCRIDGNDREGKGCKFCWVSDMLFEVDAFDTVEAEPVRHGHWICLDPDGVDMFAKHLQCSVCGYEKLGFATPYCAGCGAKMDG